MDDAVTSALPCRAKIFSRLSAACARGHFSESTRPRTMTGRLRTRYFSKRSSSVISPSTTSKSQRAYASAPCTKSKTALTLSPRHPPSSAWKCTFGRGTSASACRISAAPKSFSSSPRSSRRTPSCSTRCAGRPASFWPSRLRLEMAARIGAPLPTTRSLNEWPCVSERVEEAPARRSDSIDSGWPASAARCSGVPPWTESAASTSPPAAERSATAPPQPPNAQWWSGARPRASTALTANFLDSSSASTVFVTAGPRANRTSAAP
mmetsp:Transcript_4550/g.14416  ORF Transcript_4550/g.14416 Transcript_4550/m.14416 type:complete len:265 (-) Transcript_4550:1605-2399(-)